MKVEKIKQNAFVKKVGFNRIVLIFVLLLIRNFLNLGIIESRNYIRISYGSFLYAGTNGISPFS